MSLLHRGMRCPVLLVFEWLESTKSGSTSVIAKASISLEQRSAEAHITTVHIVRALRTHVVNLVHHLLILSEILWRCCIQVHIA